MNSYKLVHQSDWRRVLQGSAWVLVSSWEKNLTLSKIKFFLIWALRGSDMFPVLSVVSLGTWTKANQTFGLKHKSVVENGSEAELGSAELRMGPVGSGQGRWK